MNPRIRYSQNLIKDVANGRYEDAVKVRIDLLADLHLFSNVRELLKLPRPCTAGLKGEPISVCIVERYRQLKRLSVGENRGGGGGREGTG